MKWVLYILGCVVVVMLVCLLIGMLRPRGHVASSRIHLKKSREDVWAVLADFSTWPQWNSAIVAMKRESDRDGKPVWTIQGKWGDMPSVVDVFEPPSRLVTRIPEDAGVGFSGTWTYELLESPEGGSSVTITEAGEVGNPLFRFLMVFTDLHSTQRQFLTDLGKHLGEPVQPVAVEAQ